MASLYFTTATGNSGPWAGASAYATIAAALAAAAPGDTIYCDKTSSDPGTSGATTTLTSAGTPAARVKLISVTNTGAVPTAADYAPGCHISSASAYTLALLGSAYLEGITLTGGTNLNWGNATSGADWVLGPGCTAALGTGTTAAFQITLTGSVSYRLSARGDLGTGKFKFGNAAQSVIIGTGDANLRNCLALATGSVIPTNFFGMVGTRPVTLDCEGVDFTGLTGSCYLINTAAGGGCRLTASFRDCYIPSAAHILNGSLPTSGSRITLVRCSNEAGGLSLTVLAYEGGQTEDPTVTLPGGATNGVTLRSWHLTTTATATWDTPYESDPIDVSCGTTGSAVTVALEGIVAGSALPLNTEIWLEVEGLTSAPGGAVIVPASSGTTEILAASTAAVSSTATWNGAATVGSPATTFRLQTSITLAQAGYLRLRVKVAKPSSSYWVDPKPVINGATAAIGRSAPTLSGAMMNETQGTGAQVAQIIPIGGRRGFR